MAIEIPVPPVPAEATPPWGGITLQELAAFSRIAFGKLADRDVRCAACAETVTLTVQAETRHNAIFVGKCESCESGYTLLMDKPRP